MPALNATFGRSAFRQYWHPLATNQALLQDNSRVESLSKKLDAAEKTITEYSQLSEYSGVCIQILDRLKYA